MGASLYTPYLLQDRLPCSLFQAPGFWFFAHVGSQAVFDVQEPYSTGVSPRSKDWKSEAPDKRPISIRLAGGCYIICSWISGPVGTARAMMKIVIHCHPEQFAHVIFGIMKISQNHTGWWFEPLWKILVNWDDYSPYMGKFQKCSKPPTSIGLRWFCYGKLDGLSMHCPHLSRQTGNIPPVTRSAWSNKRQLNLTGAKIMGDFRMWIDVPQQIYVYIYIYTCMHLSIYLSIYQSN